MPWHVQILTTGSSDSFIKGFSDHVYLYEEELDSGHRYLYFSSQHIDHLKDPIRALYRAKNLIAIFGAIQLLNSHNVWRYDEEMIYYTDIYNTSNNKKYQYNLTDETIEQEEDVNPFGEIRITDLTYFNKYNYYLQLAQDNEKVSSVLELLHEMYKEKRYFYTNFSKIYDTIKKAWERDSMEQYSTKVKDAFDFLSHKNLHGYSNDIHLSGKESRHGYTRPLNPKAKGIEVPAKEETFKNLIILINGWLNFNLDIEKVTFEI